MSLDEEKIQFLHGFMARTEDFFGRITDEKG